MQEAWAAIAVVLLAVLVGISVPVLLQLALTLAAVRRSVNRLGPKLENTLGEVQAATGRLNRATTGLDDSVQRAQKLLVAAGDVGETIRSLNNSLRNAAAFGHAVGPAVAAAIRALADRGAHDGSGPVADDPTPSDPTPGERYNPSDVPDQGDER